MHVFPCREASLGGSAQLMCLRLASVLPSVSFLLTHAFLRHQIFRAVLRHHEFLPNASPHRNSSRRTVVNLHQCRRACAVVGGKADGSLCFLLGIWFFAKLLHSPLVHLALLMGAKVGLALKKLCAFLAVVLAEARQIFYGFRIFEFCQMLLVAQVGVDLVEVARVSARLLLGVLSSDGRHGGRAE